MCASAVWLPVNHLGPHTDVSRSAMTFSGHFGVGDALRGVVMWARIIGRKCMPL